MPVRNVPICSKCGAEIQEDPMLGDKQGAMREIVHGGTTWEIILCTKCAQPLWDLYWDYVEIVRPGGTAHGADVLKYLPRVPDDMEPLKPTRGGNLSVVKPTFSGE